MAIASPTDFICGVSVVGLGKFFEGEARNFGDHVIDGRLEAGGRLARDVVANLIASVYPTASLAAIFAIGKSSRFATPAPNCATPADSSR